ncbi:hypothetical protein BD414DRAFT_268333 [Trametes punicea]|nr:hypothetical protein BD414DRAFT_268333 [Trametes punicea]
MLRAAHPARQQISPVPLALQKVSTRFHPFQAPSEPAVAHRPRAGLLTARRPLLILMCCSSLPLCRSWRASSRVACFSHENNFFCCDYVLSTLSASQALTSLLLLRWNGRAL